MMTNDEDIRAALSYIDPHDRDTWVNTAYSLKNEFGESGFDLWDQWSQQSDNYNNRAARSVWKSIKAPKRSIGSLFHEARANGYRPEKPYTPPSAEEQAKRRAERETARLAEEAALVKKQTEVKQLSGRIWQRSEPATAGHPYLTAKGITDPAIMGQLRLNEYQGQTNLLVPVYYEREMVNLQSILPDGTKRFFEGGQVKGGYSVVGKADDYQHGLVLAEGLATAASIHQATGKPVIVAFHAGNLVPIAERLSKVLPEQVPVTIAVDNDASQTGMKKALQAAAVLGERAHVVEPEFTMTQIQRYQTENGLDSQGRPKLPSDFNDLHHLAGLDAVRRTLEPVLRQAEPPEAEVEKPVETKQPTTEQTITEPPAEQDWDAIAAEEARQRGIRLPPSPATAPSTQAADKAASLHEESDMSRTDQTSEVNAIEYDGRRQQQSPTIEPPVNQPKTVKAAPEAEPPVGQPAAKARKAEAEPEIKAQAAPSLSEKKPVLDLNYRIPPDSIKSRYVVADGQYLAADNLSTVLFVYRQRKETQHTFGQCTGRQRHAGSGERKRLGQPQAERQ
ncbi:MAG: PriCT-2 domain-containing protein [Neisseria sp.]|nr:PriCT-2 domain-containing protein [Neisseria sp.]